MRDLSWCAGLYEGEGSIYLTDTSGHKGIRMTVGSTDKDVLESFQQLMGGNLYGPYRGRGKKTPEHYKDMYQWHTSRIKLVREIVDLFWPYLSPRRQEQAAKMFSEYEYSRSTGSSPVVPLAKESCNNPSWLD